MIKRQSIFRYISLLVLGVLLTACSAIGQKDLDGEYVTWEKTNQVLTINNGKLTASILDEVLYEVDLKPDQDGEDIYRMDEKTLEIPGYIHDIDRKYLEEFFSAIKIEKLQNNKGKVLGIKIHLDSSQGKGVGSGFFPGESIITYEKE